MKTLGRALLVALVLAVVAGTSATAASLITSKQIKDGTILKRDLAPKTVTALRGQTGPAGADGVDGADGQDGQDGANSTVPGPMGPKGDTGDRGPSGYSMGTIYEYRISPDGQTIERTFRCPRSGRSSGTSKVAGAFPVSASVSLEGAVNGRVISSTPQPGYRDETGEVQWRIKAYADAGEIAVHVTCLDMTSLTMQYVGSNQ